MKPTRKNFIESVPKGLIKFAPEENSFKNFCTYLKLFVEKVNSSIKTNQTEENLKGHLKEFLLEAFYKNSNAIEPKSYKGQVQTDYVIFQTNQNNSTVEVIIEAKKPDNRNEMVTHDNLNKKALHESIFYFLFEKVTQKNNELKHLVITNFVELYIFDAQDIARLFFYEGSKLVKEFTGWQNRVLDSSNTSSFYSIVQSYIDQVSDELPFAYLNIEDLSACLISFEKEASKKKLLQAYKVLCPFNLLKKPIANDSNTLNREFYDELLHIIGLEEKAKKGKKLIQRKSPEKRNQGSLIEDLISKMQRTNKLRKVDNLHKWGQSTDEQLFNIALELSITWINRILFLKLLEAQLSKYHSKSEDFFFLNTKKIQRWSDLSFLFFEVLAKKTNERLIDLKGFNLVPYLNSSLFESTELEQELDSIDYLTQDEKLFVFEKTVLKDSQNKRLRNTELSTLEYLLKFLSAYDFGMEDSGDTRMESKSIINASVLGLIFEKINGYKDGSFFTPGYITMYMCRETIRRAVLDKFKEKYNLNCESIYELQREIYKNRISEKEANELIDSLKICDPAVGSGHFLVSALNEVISIKSDLDILIDTEGKSLGKYYKAYVENDELLIIDLETNDIIDYKAEFDKSTGKRKVSLEKTRVQKTIFHEKQKVIENCLFGVDINPNSVQICRLRLWIELLKNAYYIPDTDYKELQTLPNIDINIQQGNSLISRYALDEHLNKKNISETVKNYLEAVRDYKNSTDKSSKEDLKQKIETIKQSFHVDLLGNNKLVERKNKKITDLNKLHLQLQGYSSNLLGTVLSEKDLKKRKKEELALKKEIEKTEIEVDSIGAQIEEIKEGQIYKTGFEWRFEFPEVLDDKGDFVGFDVVIGNPPYGVKFTDIEKSKLENKFIKRKGELEIYTYFIELSIGMLLKNNGLFAFITTNTVYYLDKFADIRQQFFLDKEIISLVELEKNVFTDAPDIVPAIYLIKKSNKSNNLIHIYKSAKTKKFYDLDNFEDFSLSTVEQSLFKKKVNFVFNLSTDDLKENLILKLSTFHSIHKSFKVTYGIKTGNNQKFISPNPSKDKTWKKCTSSASNIKKYIINWTGDFIWLCNELAGLGKINYEQPKILIQYIRKLSLPTRLVCALDREGEYYPLNNFSFITSEGGVPLEPLLGILNSKLINWYFSNSFVDYNIKPKYIEKIPLPNEFNVDDLSSKVLQIIRLKSEEFEYNTCVLEREIDLIVYKLYGLTPEEATIVDPTLTDSELSLISEK